MINILLITLTILFSLLIVGTVLGRYIYKKMNHLPTGDCCYCHKNKKQLLKEYHKYYAK